VGSANPLGEKLPLFKIIWKNQVISLILPFSADVEAPGDFYILLYFLFFVTYKIASYVFLKFRALSETILSHFRVLFRLPEGYLLAT
jgi:hypothetical protein